MADAISIQELIDARTDAKTLEEAVNGDAVTTVLSRLGETYPTLSNALNQIDSKLDSADAQVKQGITNLFENGGLPATPFATKALMTASALVDGQYAMVTDDTVNNGLYVKTAGAWVKSDYDPLTQAKSYTDTVATPAITLDTSDKNKPQSGFSVYNYLEDIVELPLSDVRRNKLVKIEGSGYALINGKMTSSGMMDTSVAGFKSARFDVRGYSHIAGFALQDVVDYAILASTTLKKSGRTSEVDIEIPVGATDIYFTVQQPDTSKNYDPINDGIIFKDKALTSLGNDVLRRTDTATNLIKPVAKSTTFKLSGLPDYSTAVAFNTSLNQDVVNLFKGVIQNNGTFTPQTVAGHIVAKIPIPTGTKMLGVYLSTTHNFAIANKTLNLLLSSNTERGRVRVPDNAKFILLAVKQRAFEANLLKDKIVFYSEYDNYVLNDALGQQLIDVNDVTGLGKLAIARKHYTVEGLDFRLYKESLFGGFHPTINFNVELQTPFAPIKASDRGKYYQVINAGIVNAKAYNLKRQVIDSKTVEIFKKPMPTALRKGATPENKMQVLFIGDSLIHHNNNIIGSEWLRMLNTDQAAATTSNGVIKLPTYNLGKGNIELVGQSGSANNNAFQFANTLSSMMNNAPFYNPSSPNPNEVDADGWNKRIDIAWYLQSVCGQGKYPKYIYLACGVNDIAGFGWDVEKLPQVRNMMRSVLVRIKAACDAIAGGTSDVQIIVMNHQFYPINKGAISEFSAQLQRRIWAEHYTAYEDMIENDTFEGKKLSDFVRYVDCASSFDIEYGYDYIAGQPNPRTPAIANSYSPDTVHIGVAGAYMYADALLRDFLYHECV